MEERTEEMKMALFISLWVDSTGSTSLSYGHICFTSMVQLYFNGGEQCCCSLPSHTLLLHKSPICAGLRRQRFAKLFAFK